jgi:hypothetical protein
LLGEVGKAFETAMGRQMDTANDDDDLELSLPDGLSESERLTRSRFCPVNRTETCSPSSRPKFSLAAMMVVLFFICMGLSGAQWSATLASIFAGVLGVFVLVCIAWPKSASSNELLSPVILGGIVIAYVVACIVAVMRLFVP